LKRSPIHVEEFLQISAIHEQLGNASALNASLEDLLAEAEETVVALTDTTSAETIGADGERRQHFALAAGVLLLLGGGLLAALLVLGNGEKTYRTGFGEQRSIPLDDGTVLALNTSSEVRVRLGEQLRSATLVSGEAMFDVAKDATRPFTVSAGPLDIRVVGTRFNIYRQDAQTTLTVLEGKVEVAPLISVSNGDAPKGPLPPRAVVAGEQLVVATSGRIIAPPVVHVERAAAWTARRVIFDNEPLSKVLAEFNRYNTRTVTVSDPTLAARKVSGVFKVHDVDVLISFLQKQQDIRVVRNGDTVQIEPLP
jgi:transmembrane sensor